MSLAEIQAFLLCPTPHAWLEQAVNEQELLLIDHANCEKKAASTAINLIYRYVEHTDLLHKMSRLAREELRHFEQVIAIMEARNIAYRPISAARYAGGLHALAAKQEPQKLIDTLIIGAIIEARSCERFAAIAPRLDEELKSFYLSLLKSESRHYQDYLALAEQLAGEPIAERSSEFLLKERELIESDDREFRFHSGPVVL